MAGFQYAHSSPLSIRSNSILNCSMFYAWCVNVMQSVPGCGTVCSYSTLSHRHSYSMDTSSFDAEFTLVVELCTFVFQSTAIAWAPILTYIGSTALRKGPRGFWVHCRDYCCAVTLMYCNSPWWLSCECCNSFLSPFWLPSLIQLKQLGHHMRCALIGKSRKITTYTYMGSLWTNLEYELVGTNRVYSGIYKARVRPANRSAVATRNTSDT